VQIGSSEEKADIGARIVWSRVGVRRRWRPSQRRLRRMVEQVLTDPGIQAGVEAMEAAFARHDAAGEAADALEQLARAQSPAPR
jgi:UDP:flavonoid glycosyltransferase YjiC (YdhE family)